MNNLPQIEEKNAFMSIDSYFKMNILPKISEKNAFVSIKSLGLEFKKEENNQEDPQYSSDNSIKEKSINQIDIY